MSLAKIRSALETALAAMSPALPTIWQNDPAGDPPSGPYQRCDLLMGQPSNAEYGARSIKQGVLQITLCWPLGVNTAAIDARCDLIEQAFPRGLSLTASDQVVTISRTAWVLPGYRDAGRWCVPVRITFWSQQQVSDALLLQAQIGAYALGLGFETVHISENNYLLTADDDGKFLAFSASGRVYVYADEGLPEGFACAVAKAGAGDVTVWSGSADVTAESGLYAVSDPGGFAVLRRISPSLLLMQRGDAQEPSALITRPDFSKALASGQTALLLT